MKKFILSLFLFSLFIVPVASAEDGRSGNVAKKNVDVACVASAVGVREDAIMSAWDKFDDAVTAVLTARKSALVSAWALTDVKERRKAIKDAWATAKKSRREAAKTYASERKSAWVAFKNTVKACGGATASEASSESDSKESVEL